MNENNRITKVGIASLIMGILGFCLFFIEYSILGFRVLFNYSPFVAIITIIIGYYGYKNGDKCGKIGLILGIIQLIIVIIVFFYYFVWYPNQPTVFPS